MHQVARLEARLEVLAASAQVVVQDRAGSRHWKADILLEGLGQAGTPAAFHQKGEAGNPVEAALREVGILAVVDQVAARILAAGPVVGKLIEDQDQAAAQVEEPYHRSAQLHR